MQGRLPGGAGPFSVSDPCVVLPLNWPKERDVKVHTFPGLVATASSDLVQTLYVVLRSCCSLQGSVDFPLWMREELI